VTAEETILRLGFVAVLAFRSTHLWITFGVCSGLCPGRLVQEGFCLRFIAVGLLVSRDNTKALGFWVLGSRGQ
jgi:hypothetical protein